MGAPRSLIYVPQVQVLAGQAAEQVQQGVHVHIAVIIHLQRQSILSIYLRRRGQSTLSVGKAVFRARCKLQTLCQPCTMHSLLKAPL